MKKFSRGSLLLHLATFAVAAFFVSPVLAQQDLTNIRIKHKQPDLLHFDTAVAITGTWSCTAESTTCTEDTAAGSALTQLVAGDFIVIDTRSYEVASVTDDDNFERVREVKADGTYYSLAAVVSKTVYTIGTGVNTAGVPTTLYGGTGDALPLQMSSATLNEAAGNETAVKIAYTTNKVAGNDTGLQVVMTDSLSPGVSYLLDLLVTAASKFSVDNAGNTIAAGSTTADSAVIGGGYGSSGATISNAGVVQADGALTAGGLISTTIDGNDSATGLISATNSNVPLTGETGDTASISFNLFGSVNGVAASHEAARIEAYKVSDWFHAADETDHDSGLKLYSTVNGTETLTADLKNGIVYGNDFRDINGAFSLYTTEGLFLRSTGITAWTTSTLAASADVHLFRYNDGAATFLAVGDGAGTAETDATGRLYVGLGSATKMGLAIGDEDTGWYSSSAGVDQSAAVNGAEILEINANGVKIEYGAISRKACTIADGDATPSVAGCEVLTTSANTNPTAITDLDNPVVGTIVRLVGGSATNSSTIADAGNFNLAGNWTAAVDDVLTLYVVADNDYIELGRSDN